MINSYFSLSAWTQTELPFIDRRIISIAAVYWSENNVLADAGVYTRWIPDLDDASVGDELKASIRLVYEDAAWAYIVTWDKMRPYGSPFFDEV